ncbi:MAG: secretin N-terminal domain-containing protein [Sulfurimicrobium sp.]|nr:secretin N-terminal domain-containing protein [Sulfurimicrobium sp.]
MSPYWIAGVAGVLLLGACSTQQGLIPPPMLTPKELVPGAATALPAPARGPLVQDTPKPPPAARLRTGKEAPPAPQPAAAEEANVTLMFDQLPLPTFIQVVYGNILKKNFNLDPQVASRSDMVTLRTGQPQTPTQVAETAKMLLKSYGIAVTEISPGFYRIVPDNNLQGYMPEIRRGRALPEVPLPLRPIFQLVELQAVRNTEVAGWVKSMFGQRVNLQEDPNRNAVLLNGQSDDVMAALEVIHVLDQPLMKGRQSTRINPAFWSAEELAKKLTEILQSEGYGASNTPSSNYPLTLLPIQAINAIIVFSADAATLSHVVEWSRTLDKPSTSRGAGSSYFTYQARYTDAKELAVTLQDLISGAATAVAAPAAGQTASVAKRPARVVVNNATNTLIFQGNTEDYTQLLNLLQELDKPAKSALIEVTVAEVKLTDTTQLGVEWAFNASGAKGTTIKGGTLGGLGIGSGGFTVKRLNSMLDTQLILNAMASSNKVNILSSPRIIARNGEAATIQVGSEVPVITSQQTSPTTGGTGSVLQSIQYRSTGVILKVRPVIHAGDRVDLDITQEVSSAESTTTGVSTSPTISTRKLDTKLSLRDGTTVLLGGLISSNKTQGESGIPLLKDIPVLGQIFRTNNDTEAKTELLVLITPYIVADDHDAIAVTEAFRKQLGPWAQYRPAPAGKAPLPAPLPKPEVEKPAIQAAPAEELEPSAEEAAQEKTPAGLAEEPQPALPAAPEAATAPAAQDAVVTDPKLLQELKAAMEREKAAQPKAPAKPK